MKEVARESHLIWFHFGRCLATVLAAWRILELFWRPRAALLTPAVQAARCAESGKCFPV